MNIKKTLGVAVLALASVGVANAATMTLTLTNSNFLSGGTLTGAFNYNTLTNTYSNWSLTADLTNAPAGSADPYTYTTGNSVIDNGVFITSFATSASRVAFYSDLNSVVASSFRELNFKFSAALTTITADGQTLNLLATNPGASADTFFDGIGQTTVSTLTGGVLTVSNFDPGVTVPTPAPLWLLGVGGMVLMGFKRRNKAASVDLQA